MPIATVATAVKVDEVASMVVTAIEQDPVTGEYVREVRLFGASDLTGIPIFRLQVRSETRAGVEYATPPLTL